MDSVSQFVLGAAVAEFTVGKRLGNRALLWGGVAGTIPDLDVVSQFFMDDFLALTYHRGFSHSLIFCFLFAPVLGWVYQRIHANRGATFKEGSLMAFWCFATHIALDCCTSWGTQVFWPLEPRLSTNSVFVVDPLYTVPIILCLLALLFFPRKSEARRALNTIGLILSTSYLVWGIAIKPYVNGQFEEAFAKSGFDVLDFESRPTPMNTILWTANAETEDEYLLAFYSILDEDNEMDFIHVQKRHSLLDPLRTDENVQRVLRMTQGWYSVEQTDSCLVVNDLRFGQPNGWDSEPDDFVFQYVLMPQPDGNIKVVVPEPPRPDSEEASRLLEELFHRAMGNKPIPQSTF